MLKKVPVSVLIMTKNEESNIRQCLESVKWAEEIVIVDSESTDRTLDIVKEYTENVYQYVWDGKWPKKSWSLEFPNFRYDWILMIDADERATPEFRNELETILADEKSGIAGYRVKYRYWFLGRYIKFGDPVRKLVLFRKSKSHFEKYDISGIEALQNLEIGHEHPIIDGKIAHMKQALLHHDTRPLYYYFDRHNRYSTWEAFLITRGKYRGFFSVRRLFKYLFLHMPFKPFAYFVYSYIFRLGFLDGYPGFAYNLCKAFYSLQIGLKIKDSEIRRNE